MIVILKMSISNTPNILQFFHDECVGGEGPAFTGMEVVSSIHCNVMVEFAPMVRDSYQTLFPIPVCMDF